MYKHLLNNLLLTSVVNPHHIDADPDPDSTYHPDTDPNCDFYFITDPDAYPDPDFSP